MPTKNFGAFVEGFYAAFELLNRARAQGFYVEQVVLAAALIDGLVRLGLVLQHQLDSRSSEVPDELIFQAEGTRALTERAIYDRALAVGILSDALYADLNALYDTRNRVIHRYLISRITTAQVVTLAKDYDAIIPQLNERVAALEIRQVNERIGMVQGSSPHDKAELDAHYIAGIERKHGDSTTAAFLRIGLPASPVDNDPSTKH